MIRTSRTVSVGDTDSTINLPIILYKGDRGVEVLFEINNRFKFVDSNNLIESSHASYGQLVIRNENGVNIFSEIKACDNGKVALTITRSMTDEINEIGTYTFQIRLYNSTMDSRVTLPPVYEGLEIREPIAEEEDSVVNQARINNATVSYVSEEIDIFDEEGNYNKTEWIGGDVISDARMNKIEDALYTINNKIGLSDGSDDSDGFESDIESIKNDVDAVELECEQIKNDNTQIKSDIETIFAMIDEPPTYSKPTISISLSNTNIEHSKSYDISITTNFTKNDAGNVVGYKVYKNNTVIFENTSIAKYTDTISITHGTSVTYKTEVSYGDGLIKNTSLGIPYPSTSIKGGAVSATSTVKGYALSYYGVIDGSEFTSTTGLTSELRTDKGDTITVSLTNQRVIYMYPKSFGNLTSIKDANNFDYINSYTLSTETVNGVEYNIYILTDPVTITNFKQIYN